MTLPGYPIPVVNGAVLCLAHISGRFAAVPGPDCNRRRCLRRSTLRRVRGRRRRLSSFAALAGNTKTLLCPPFRFHPSPGRQMEWGGWRVQAALLALLALLLPAWTVPLLVMDNAHHGCCVAEFRCSACGAGFCHSRASPQAGLASAFAASFRPVRRVCPQDLGSCHLVSRLRLRLRVGRACRRVNVAMAASGKSATAHDGDGGSRKKVRSPLTGRQIYVGGSAFQNVIDLGYIFVNGELVHRNCVEQGPNGESIILGETAPSLAPACKRGAGAEPYPHTSWRAWCVQVICRP